MQSETVKHFRSTKHFRNLLKSVFKIAKFEFKVKARTLWPMGKMHPIVAFQSGETQINFGGCNDPLVRDGLKV